MTDPRPDLTEAQDTDEIHRIAAQLAAWGLRNGHCDVDNVVDWVLDHPHQHYTPEHEKYRGLAKEAGVNVFAAKRVVDALIRRGLG